VDDPPLADERALVARVREGEPRAFEALVRQYQHRVFGVAARMLGSAAEAEEVAQEVFLRVHRAIGEFRGDSKLSTWLYAITSRVCLSRLGGGHRRIVREGEEVLTRLASGEADPAAALERTELEMALHRAIGELPEERRVVVILRDLQGLAYEEIAAALELPVGTVRSRLHRARMDLKDKLERFFA
jgi:RNA polymerase sigma-70 factor, ECF subfamily